MTAPHADRDRSECWELEDGDTGEPLLPAPVSQHIHVWVYHQNVTSRGYALPPYEACTCGAARPTERVPGVDAETLKVEIVQLRVDLAAREAELSELRGRIARMADRVESGSLWAKRDPQLARKLRELLPREEAPDGAA